MKKQIDFLIEGVKNIKEMGALTRSGPILCKKMEMVSLPNIS